MRKSQECELGVQPTSVTAHGNVSASSEPCLGNVSSIAKRGGELTVRRSLPQCLLILKSSFFLLQEVSDKRKPNPTVFLVIIVEFCRNLIPLVFFFR